MNPLTALLGIGIGAGVLYVASKDKASNTNQPKLPPPPAPCPEGMVYNNNTKLCACPGEDEVYDPFAKKCIVLTNKKTLTHPGEHITMGTPKQYLRPYGYRTGACGDCGCVACQAGDGDCNFNKLKKFVTDSNQPGLGIRTEMTPVYQYPISPPSGGANTYMQMYQSVKQGPSTNGGGGYQAMQPVMSAPANSWTVAGTNAQLRHIRYGLQNRRRSA